MKQANTIVGLNYRIATDVDETSAKVSKRIKGDNTDNDDDDDDDEDTLLDVAFPFFESPTILKRKAVEAERNNKVDPSAVGFRRITTYTTSEIPAKELAPELASQYMHGNYPFSVMMHGSAPYIAMHAGKVAVFHIPGELLASDDKKEDEIKNKASNQLFEDIALAWLLGIKIVIVAGCRYAQDVCEFFEHSHECQNSLQVTDAKTLRKIEEEAGYVRTEVERKLNKCLKHHTTEAEGNVVSGNFYTGNPFGTIRGKDFQYTGYCAEVNSDSIQSTLNNNDVVLLTTVGVSPLGELVNVNGYHLAAAVAASLSADKLIYMSNDGCVLEKNSEPLAGCESNENLDGSETTQIKELPLTFAQAITDYHQVKVHNTGFATFESARKTLDPAALELLLHMGWASWALEHGVDRAHIVNPNDGALLEELFTSKNGANTCLYHDEEDEPEVEEPFDEDDWDAFFSSASKQEKGTILF